MSEGHSISRLLSGVNRGDQAAVESLFAKCYSRIVHIACRKLAIRPQQGCDEDDVANTAFREFFSRTADGDFKKLENREDVWQILTLLVGDKIGDRRRHELRKKRGGGVPNVPLEEVADAISQVDDPTLEAEINDAKEYFLANLPSDDHRKVVELTAAGLTHEEIAEKLGLSVRTVDRRFEDVRLALPAILGIDPPKKKSSGKGPGRGKASHGHDE